MTHRVMRNVFRVCADKPPKRPRSRVAKANDCPAHGRPVSYIARQWTAFPAGWVVLVCPWWGRTGYQVSVERRRGTLATPETLETTRCTDAAELLASVQRAAQRLAREPAPTLRIMIADDVGSGLSARIGLLLLAAVHAVADDMRKAA